MKSNHFSLETKEVNENHKIVIVWMKLTVKVAVKMRLDSYCHTLKVFKFSLYWQKLKSKVRLLVRSGDFASEQMNKLESLVVNFW